MTKKSLAALLVAMSVAALAWAGDGEAPHSFKPRDGYVPDAATAIKIAVAVWEPIYGADQIAKEKPYRAGLANGVWTVQGTVPSRSLGGAAIAEIARDDARILRVSHGK